MKTEYRFPILPEERVSLLVAGIVGAGVLCTMAWFLYGVGLEHDPDAAFAVFESRRVRGALASAIGLYIIAIFGFSAYAYRHGKTRICVEDGYFTYVRPPWPVTRHGGLSVTVPLSRVEVLGAERQRFGMSHRWCVLVRAGDEDLALAAEACIGEGLPRTVRVRNKEAAMNHPLTRHLSSLTHAQP